ncbi:MAG: hypothetical protein R3293_10090 [Candidatus Promineifilaceae bacterium]|nr:hypothetical protein [Candidatus Promineifilaceae bacterium]
MLEVKNKFRIFLIIIALTILLAIPRFNHYVAPDSTHYVELAAYFDDSLAREELRPPFVYRILVPYLASLGPTSLLDLNFAIINTGFTIAAFIVFYFYLQKLLDDRTQFNFGLLLLIVAFPTINYASGVMTDAAGFFFFVLATYLFLIKRFFLFTAVLTIGVMAREAILVLLLAVVVYQVSTYLRGAIEKRRPWLFLSLVPPILIYLSIRLYFSDLPSFFWSPSWRQLIFTVSRPVAWTTFLLTLVPPLFFISIAYKQQLVPTAEIRSKWSFHTKSLLLSLTIAAIFLNIYSITSAALSGRFVWPFYVVLVPMAAAYFRDDGSPIFSMTARIANKIFGNPSMI